MDDAAFRKMLAEAPMPAKAGAGAGGVIDQAQAPNPTAPDQYGVVSGAGVEQAVSDAAHGEAPGEAAGKMLDPTQGGIFPSGGQDARPDPLSHTPTTADGQKLPPNAPGAEPGVTDPSAPFVEAPIAGFTKGIYEVDDFSREVFHEPKAERSVIRKAIEREGENQGLGYSLSSGIWQFGVGLLGAGKVVDAAKGIKYLGGGIRAVQNMRGGSAALEATKAAGAGAAAFDPHQDRISNLIQGYPQLQNPVTAYLAAKPGDSAAEGRFKNALESIGMDATVGLGLVFLRSLRAQKALQSGDAATIASTNQELQAAMDGHAQMQEQKLAASQPMPEGQAPVKVAPEAQPGVTDLGDINVRDPVQPPPPPREDHVDHAGRTFFKEEGHPYKLSGDTQATGGAQAKLSDFLFDKEKMRAPERIEPTMDGGPDALPEGGPEPRASPEPIQGPSGESVTPQETYKLSDLMRDTTQPGPDTALGRTYDTLRKIIGDEVGDYRVHTVSDQDIGKLWGQGNGVTSTADAYHWAGPDHIVIKSSVLNDPYRGPSILVHEAMHAAVFKKLEADPEVKDFVRSLMERTQRHLGQIGEQRDWYGLKNEHEFMSEAISNDHFQHMLSQIKLVPQEVEALGLRGKIGNLWDAVVAKLREAFGLPEEAHSVLDAALRVPTMLSERARAAEQTTGGYRPAAMEARPEGPGAGKDDLPPEMRGGTKRPDPDTIEQVKNPTEGAQREGAQKPPPRVKLAGVSEEQLRSLEAGIRSDIEAFQKFGTWDNAINAGHVFGKGGDIPWNKLAAQGPELDNFARQVVTMFKDDIDAAKGGAVLTDQRANAMAQQLWDLYGIDPEATLGHIQAAGKMGPQMVASMEAGYMIAQRGFQSFFALANKVRVGDLEAFGGSVEAAQAQLKAMVQVAVTAYQAARSLTAAGGRITRRHQLQFKPDPAVIAAMDDAQFNWDAFIKNAVDTGGDPRILERITTPDIVKNFRTGLQALFINNLLWGWKTHLFNGLGSVYTTFFRPMERVMGTYVQQMAMGAEGAAEAARTRAETLQRYVYMHSALNEAFQQAAETWRTGDSLLTPHEMKGLQELPGQDLRQPGSVQQMGGQPTGFWEAMSGNAAQIPWKPVNSWQDALHNAYIVAAPKILTAPGRALGTVDELVKQTVYRSTVMGKAHVEALRAGLEGKEFDAYVKQRLFGAFDDAGRAIDTDALREAQVATFQTDLVPNTLGSSIQHMVANWPFARYVFPFVKTPINALNYGFRLTPGLGLLQKEFRMEISGQLGATRQADAIGQTMMGGLFAMSAAWLAHMGMVTGGPPGDPRLRKAQEATGKQWYSFVIGHADGSKTYIPYNRLDPMAMPFGLVADISDVLHASDDAKIIEKAGSTLAALGWATAKNITNRTFLTGASTIIDALSQPEQKFNHWAGQLMSNFIPFSTALKAANPDPNMRAARSMVDQLKATIPGLSETLPPQRDAFGDPIATHKGLWVTSDSDMVDAEMRRLAEKPGADGEALGPPQSRFQGGVDLQNLTLKDGTNAYDQLQQYARQPLPGMRPVKDQVRKLMGKPTYQNAPDGDAKTPGTKMNMLASTMAPYRTAATRLMMAKHPEVREAATQRGQAVADYYADRKADREPTVGERWSSAVQQLLPGSSAPPAPGRPSADPSFTAD